MLARDVWPYAVVCIGGDGWGRAGTLCEKEVNGCKQKPCQNGGTCSESSTDSWVAIGSYACVCSGNAWEGRSCQDDINECLQIPRVCDLHKPCKNKPGGYTCGKCSPGWQANTDDPLVCDDVSECLSSPCQNGAACLESGNDSRIITGAYICICLGGFSGPECGTLPAKLEPEPEPCNAHICGIPSNGYVGSGQCTHGVCECNSWVVHIPANFDFDHAAAIWDAAGHPSQSRSQYSMRMYTANFTGTNCEVFPPGNKQCCSSANKDCFGRQDCGCNGYYASPCIGNGQSNVGCCGVRGMCDGSC